MEFTLLWSALVGVAGLYLGLWWMGRRDTTLCVRDLWEIAIAAGVIGLAGWHAGCLFRDACLGTPTSLPWAWSQPGSDITRHPIELYTALLLAIAAWLLFRLRLRYPAAGLVAGLSLAVAGASRLVTEPLRPSLFTGPVWWYAAAIVLGGAVAVLAWRQPKPASTADDAPPLQ